MIWSGERLLLSEKKVALIQWAQDHYWVETVAWWWSKVHFVDQVSLAHLKHIQMFQNSYSCNPFMATFERPLLVCVRTIQASCYCFSSVCNCSLCSLLVVAQHYYIREGFFFFFLILWVRREIPVRCQFHSSSCDRDRTGKKSMGAGRAGIIIILICM